MTLKEIQYKAQSIIHEVGDDDSAPYVEFVEELASMCVKQPSEDLEAAVEGIIVGSQTRNDIEMQADEFCKATANFKDGDKVKVIIVKED